MIIKEVMNNENVCWFIPAFSLNLEEID